MKLITLLPAIIGLTAAAPTSDTTFPIAPGAYFKVALYAGPNCTSLHQILNVKSKDHCYVFSGKSAAVIAYDPKLPYNVFHGYYGEGCTDGFMPVLWKKEPYCQSTETIKSVQVVL